VPRPPISSKEYTECDHASEAVKALGLDSEVILHGEDGKNGAAGEPDIFLENNGKRIWIEHTSIPNADPKTETRNHTQEAFCLEIQQLLEDLAPVEHGWVRILILFKKIPPLGHRQRVIKELAHRALQALSNSEKKLKNPNDYIDYMTVKPMITNKTGYMVTTAYQYVPSNLYLDDRLATVTRTKEKKKYSSIEADDLFWLLIRVNVVDADRQVLDALKCISSDIFDRILVQLDYQPGLGYPLRDLTQS